MAFSPAAPGGWGSAALSGGTGDGFAAVFLRKMAKMKENDGRFGGSSRAFIKHEKKHFTKYGQNYKNMSGMS
ncbi:MAG: hypothetical protein LUC48_04850 [Clostridiales bacterium]|nr:hypothetical protein [Clostridiales bacterium]